MSQRSHHHATVLILNIIFVAAALRADTLTFQNNKTMQGTVLQTNGEDVLVLTDFGAMRFGTASLKSVRPDPTTQMGSSSTNRIPQIKPALLQLTRQPWASKLEQIPATVIDTGILRNVPYISFRCGDDYEINVYGDLSNPAGIEAGVNRQLVNDPDARKNCLSFIGSLLLPEDSEMVSQLNTTKDIQTRNGITFEITPPTDPDAYGGWWISVYSERYLNKARATDAELKQISVSKADATIQAKKEPGSEKWTLEELDKARPSEPDTITIISDGGIVHTNARVISVNDGVSLMWRDGASGGIAKLADLSPKFQAKYHYDPVKAAAADAAEAEKKQRQLATIAQTVADAADSDSFPSATYSSYGGGSSLQSSSSGGSVYVKGYTRSNGTYVHSYTRSAPRR